MEKEKVLFVYNPRAGKGTLRNKLADIIDLMMKRQGMFRLRQHRRLEMQPNISYKRESAVTV